MTATLVSNILQGQHLGAAVAGIVMLTIAETEEHISVSKPRAPHRCGGPRSKDQHSLSPNCVHVVVALTHLDSDPLVQVVVGQAL